MIYKLGAAILFLLFVDVSCNVSCPEVGISMEMNCTSIPDMGRVKIIEFLAKNSMKAFYSVSNYPEKYACDRMRFFARNNSLAKNRKFKTPAGRLIRYNIQKHDLKNIEENGPNIFVENTFDILSLLTENDQGTGLDIVEYSLDDHLNGVEKGFYKVVAFDERKEFLCAVNCKLYKHYSDEVFEIWCLATKQSGIKTLQDWIETNTKSWLWYHEGDSAELTYSKSCEVTGVLNDRNYNE